MVLQGQFELARRIFADGAFQRHAQGVGGGPQFLQERRGLLHFAQRILIVLGRARAGERPARKLHTAAGRALLIEHEEFQFAGDDRGQAVLDETFDDARQHMTGIEANGRIVELVDRKRDLSDVGPEPGRHRQTSRYRASDLVGVAALPDQPGLLDILAGDVGHQQR